MTAKEVIDDTVAGFFEIAARLGDTAKAVVIASPVAPPEPDPLPVAALGALAVPTATPPRPADERTFADASLAAVSAPPSPLIELAAAWPALAP